MTPCICVTNLSRLRRWNTRWLSCLLSVLCQLEHVTQNKGSPDRAMCRECAYRVSWIGEIGSNESALCLNCHIRTSRCLRSEKMWNVWKNDKKDWGPMDYFWSFCLRICLGLQLLISITYGSVLDVSLLTLNRRTIWYSRWYFHTLAPVTWETVSAR